MAQRRHKCISSTPSVVERRARSILLPFLNVIPFANTFECLFVLALQELAAKQLMHPFSRKAQLQTRRPASWCFMCHILLQIALPPPPSLGQTRPCSHHNQRRKIAAASSRDAHCSTEKHRAHRSTEKRRKAEVRGGGGWAWQSLLSTATCTSRVPPRAWA